MQVHFLWYAFADQALFQLTHGLVEVVVVHFDSEPTLVDPSVVVTSAFVSAHDSASGLSADIIESQRFHLLCDTVFSDDDLAETFLV